MRFAPNRIEYQVGQPLGECIYLGDEVCEKDGCGQKRRKGKFKCRCGKEFIASINHVKYGSTNSCGCFNPANLKHGGRYTSEYRAWCKMKERCLNPNTKEYIFYGGRGIKICDRWLNSFENFLSDVGKRPSPKHSLDRFPNNNGDYEPLNFRWATKKEQSNNRRSNIILTHNGKTNTLSGWANELNIKPSVLRIRLSVLKWTVEEALSTPIIRSNRFLYKKSSKLTA